MAGIVLGVIGTLIAIALIALAVSAFNSPAGRSYRQCLAQSAGNTTLIERCMTDFSHRLRS